MLSVVVVSWNTRELLRDCLGSLYAATHLASEVIVVDNGSSDGTLGMLAVDFPDVRVIRNETNRGFAAANNQGIAIALGRYLLLLNSDTVVHADALDRLVAFMEVHPEAGACGPQLLNPDGSLQRSGRAFPTLFQGVVALVPMPLALRRALAEPIEKRDYNQVAIVDEVMGSALLLRRAAIEQVGRLDEHFFFLGEDVDLCWRLSKGGWKIYYVPQAVVTHLGGGSRRQLSERTSLQAQRGYVLLFRKHRPGLPASLITIITVFITLLKAVKRTALALASRDRSALVTSWRLHRDELIWLIKSEGGK